jgi:hypothetical protein
MYKNGCHTTVVFVLIHAIITIAKTASVQPLYLRRMRARKGLLLVVAVILLASVFFPWLIIESKNIIVSGIQAEGTAFGKPGLLSLFFTALIIIFSLVPRVWAHRICIFTAALNTGWAVRNFLLLSTCQGGECPQRQVSFYVYLISATLLLVAVLIQEVRLPSTEKSV